MFSLPETTMQTNIFNNSRKLLDRSKSFPLKKVPEWRKKNNNKKEHNSSWPNLAFYEEPYQIRVEISIHKLHRIQIPFSSEITHTWTITNFDNLIKNKMPIALSSNEFPTNCTSLQFLLRMVVNYNDKYVALFLILKNNNDLINSTLKPLETMFYFQIKNKNKEICCSKKTKKLYIQNKNCHGVENVIDIETLKNSLTDNTVTIKCVASLKNNFNNFFANNDSQSETKVQCFSNHFKKIIEIKNFTKNFYKTEFPIIESDLFSPDHCSYSQFSFVIVKEKNSKHKETGFVSFYLKHCSKTISIFNLIWKFSVLSRNKKPFMTSEGTSTPTSINFMVGSPNFILEESLFNFDNNLLVNDILTLYVDLNINTNK